MAFLQLTARGGLDCQHGLIMHRMIFKPRSCKKLTGIINKDRVPINHVNGSLQIGRIMHEMIMLAILGDGCSARCTAHVKCMVYVESCGLSF